MLHKSKVDVCRDPNVTQNTHREHHVEFLNVNLLKPSGFFTYHQV